MRREVQRRLDELARKRLGRPLTGRVERSSPWALLLFAVSALLSLLPGALGSAGGGFAALLGTALALLLWVLLWRWARQRLLWTVRNRLVATCLLMGLAPVVLFGTLAGIAGYVLSGQFATNTARSTLEEALERVKTNDGIMVAPLLHEISLHPAAAGFPLPLFPLDAGDAPPQTRMAIAVWDGAKPLRLESPKGVAEVEAAPFPDGPPPAWLHSGFQGVVASGGKLLLCSAIFAGDDRHTLLIVATSPLNANGLAAIAGGLGNISILPMQEDGAPGYSFHRAQGGAIARPAHFFDPRVYFSAPLHITEWSTGADRVAMLGVVSRPSVLYGRLLAGSVGVGAVVRDALLAVAGLFSLIELLALLMAVRLSRTITNAVADLYRATGEVDRGNFAHRVQVRRDDQLGALATSFNAMAGSLSELLEQQREKERMENELEIAQQVQNSLFPPGPVRLRGFELHGVCKPARTVSGDYYDFLLAGEGEVCLALGDISGKGISAALLMASLHAAVRAFCSAGDGSPAECPFAFRLAPPANLLSRLNRHLLASTTPEKYATLFLGCYTSATRELRYSNGGQLPPLLLCADGQVKRLDCGGAVVGLLDGMVYQEASVTLHEGDLLLAYSDGATEPENGFGEFGEERLLEAVWSKRSEPLAAISEHAMRALGSWIGGAEQPDDITLVLGRQL